jgi:hypothetical protein
MEKCAEKNPDLPYSLIKEILIGLDELDQGEKTEYRSHKNTHGHG